MTSVFLRAAPFDGGEPAIRADTAVVVSQGHTVTQVPSRTRMAVAGIGVVLVGILFVIGRRTSTRESGCAWTATAAGWDGYRGPAVGGGRASGLPADSAVEGGRMVKPEPEQVARRSTHGRLAALSGFVLAGLVTGVAAKIADESEIGWVADLNDYPAVWMLVLALMARAAPTAGASAVTAGAFFAAMVGGYYGWARLVLGFPWGPEPLYWLSIAALAVPLAAAAAWWAVRSAGAVAGLVLSAMAVLAVYNGALPRAVRALTGHLPFELVRPVQVGVEISVTILLIGVLPHHRRARWWAIGAWLPLMWLAPRVLGPVLGRIGLG